MTIQEFNKTVDLYSDNLFRFFVKNISDREASQDLVQESFTKMWSKVRDVEFAKSKSYLFTVGYHTMIDHIRAKKRRDNYLALQDAEKYEEKDYDLKDALDHALNQLPQIQKSVVLLRDYEGYSYEEIGQLANLSESQVKVYLFRARKTLKDKLLLNKNIFPTVR